MLTYASSNPLPAKLQNATLQTSGSLTLSSIAGILIHCSVQWPHHDRIMLS